MTIITPSLLNDEQISTAKLVDGSVTTIKVADDNITQAKLAHDINISHLINDSGYITDISTFDTGDLTEGTNLYFTNQRAVDAVEAETSLSIGNLTHTSPWTLVGDNNVTISDGSVGTGGWGWWQSTDWYVGAGTGVQIQNTAIDVWGGGATKLDINTNVDIQDDLSIGGVLQLAVTDHANLPGTPVEGMVAYLNTDSLSASQKKPIYYDGTDWRYFSDDSVVA